MPLASDSRPEAIKLLKIINCKKPKTQEEEGDEDDDQGSDQAEEEAEKPGKKKGKGAQPKPEKKEPKAKAKPKDLAKCEGVVDPKKAMQGLLPRPCEACVCCRLILVIAW